MNRFGKELGKYLQLKKISLEVFSEKINITPENLKNIINGNIEISQNIIYNIAYITGIPVNYIENTEQNYKIDKIIDKYLKNNNLPSKKYLTKLNYKELFNKYHLTYTDSRNDYAIIRDLLKYFKVSNMEELIKFN